MFAGDMIIYDHFCSSGCTMKPLFLSPRPFPQPFAAILSLALEAGTMAALCGIGGGMIMGQVLR